MSKMMVWNTCPMCNSYSAIELDADKFNAYKAGAWHIQEIFPELNPMEREFVKTGYCPDCQALLFGTEYPADNIIKMQGGGK